MSWFPVFLCGFAQFAYLDCYELVGFEVVCGCLFVVWFVLFTLCGVNSVVHLLFCFYL